jgi:hypothetical protein
MASLIPFYIVPMLAFILVSMPSTYKMVASLLGSWVASADGLPKMGGLILHSIVFLFVVRLLMYFTGAISRAMPPSMQQPMIPSVPHPK